MADIQGPDDAELDEFAQKLRPRPVATALSVIATVTLILGVIVAGLVLTCSEAGRPHAAPPAAAPDAGAPDDGSPVVVTDLDWSIQLSPGALTVASQTVTITAPVPGSNPPASTYGTGFLITDGLVVSAAHVVTAPPGGMSVRVRVNCDGNEVDGDLIAYDAVRDVMAIFAPECLGDDLRFTTRRLSVDEELHIAGYMFSMNTGVAFRFHRSTSYVPGATLRPTDAAMDQTLAERLREMRRLRIPRYRALAGAAIPGNSGSPVFDDGGRIVGMLVIRDARHDRSYIVPSRTILRVLRANGLP